MKFNKNIKKKLISITDNIVFRVIVSCIVFIFLFSLVIGTVVWINPQEGQKITFFEAYKNSLFGISCFFAIVAAITLILFIMAILLEWMFNAKSKKLKL